MDLYPHKSGLGLVEPVAQINQNIAVYWGNKWLYRLVIYLEAIPPFQFLNCGQVLLTAIHASPTKATNLEVRSNEFAQYRWFPLDNVQVYLWLPTSSGRQSLKNVRVPTDLYILDRDPCLHLTEFFVWQDNVPYFQPLNPMDYTVAQSRLVAMGFRFITEELAADVVGRIKAGTEPCTYVVAQGRE